MAWVTVWSRREPLLSMTTASSGMRVARRQRSRQVVPTGLLHPLIVVASGQNRCEANPISRVGKILRQRGRDHRISGTEHAFYSMLLARQPALFRIGPRSQTIP
jgi:hypothetical protein